MAPLPLQPSALLAHPARLPAQLTLHLTHSPHVLFGHSDAGPRTLLTQARSGERDRGSPLGATGDLQRNNKLQFLCASRRNVRTCELLQHRLSNYLVIERYTLLVWTRVHTSEDYFK